MSTVQTARPTSIPTTPRLQKYPWLRLLILMLLLVLSIVLYSVLIMVAPPQPEADILPFLRVWMLAFLPYFAASAFILATKPPAGRWRWFELGVILGGALIFRAMLLPLPPNLSHDAWRYLWDARVTLHGYSPYVYAPGHPALIQFRDALIFGNSRYRNSPTIYPPGAQAIYLLSYLIAPSNLFFLKGIFMLFDMVTCGALAILLARKGLDPSRMLIYAWCPLPIIEFAIQGHVDVLTVTFTVLAVLCAASTWRGSRVVTGFFIAMATLTKIYPILLLIALVRRRDWALLATCFATIAISYIPYLILGHGQVLGYFATYTGEQGGNAGIVQLLLYWLGSAHGFSLATTIMLQHIVDLIVVLIVALTVLVLRVFKSIKPEAAILILFGTVFSISSHIFPWYVPVLLPWVAVLVGPLWTRNGIRAAGLAIVVVWYFICISLTGYFFNNTRDWHVYYEWVYGIVMAGLGAALLLGLWTQLKQWHKFSLVGTNSSCLLPLPRRGWTLRVYLWPGRTKGKGNRNDAAEHE